VVDLFGGSSKTEKVELVLKSEKAKEPIKNNKPVTKTPITVKPVETQDNAMKDQTPNEDPSEKPVAPNEPNDDHSVGDNKVAKAVPVESNTNIEEKTSPPSPVALEAASPQDSEPQNEGTPKQTSPTEPESSSVDIKPTPQKVSTQFVLYCCCVLKFCCSSSLCTQWIVLFQR